MQYNVYALYRSSLLLDLVGKQIGTTESSYSTAAILRRAMSKYAVGGLYLGWIKISRSGFSRMSKSIMFSVRSKSLILACHLKVVNYV